MVYMIIGMIEHRPFKVLLVITSLLNDNCLINKISLKRKGCQVVVSVLIVFVRHLGTFVNASHNWYTVSPLPKS